MIFPVIRRLSIVLLALAASSAFAAEWAIEPAVESRASLTDNINLTPGVHDNVFSWLVAPRVNFSRSTEATDIAGAASVGFNRYPGNSDLDTDDANVLLTSQLRNERSIYGLLAAYVRDSTLESELATTGIVQARRQRNLVSLSPSWNYALTEQSSVSAQYRYDQATYEAGAGLTDYSNQQMSAGYQYLLSERTAATLSGGYSRYEADDGSILTNSYNLTIGLVHSPTERLTFNAGIGGRRTDSTQTRTALRCEFGSLAVCEFFGVPLQRVSATSKTSDDGMLFNASADYRWERTTANLSLGRDINPTGSGLVVQTDRLALALGHQFSDKLSVSAGSAYLMSRYLHGQGSATDYFRVDSVLSWRFDERWTTAASYSFAYQKIKDVPESASANTIFLSISYSWQKISISR